jgi:hypothetical protein
MREMAYNLGRLFAGLSRTSVRYARDPAWLATCCLSLAAHATHVEGH